MIWPMRQFSGGSGSLRPACHCNALWPDFDPRSSYEPPSQRYMREKWPYTTIPYMPGAQEKMKSVHWSPSVKERYHSNEYEFKYEQWR